MGSSYYSDDDYKHRTSLRSDTAKSKGIDISSATMSYSHDIDTGKTDAKVHPTLDPKGVKIRESRDSVGHPIAVPIAVFFDTTGSMSGVPFVMQKQLSKLMGYFLNDKASGKKYLGAGYPAIMIGGVDDFNAMHGNGALQVGQFESGIEIDDNLTNMWITHRGGGTYEESYDLALYFMANHTVHDHWEKRHKKGYLFLIGDEHPYGQVLAHEVKEIIGDVIEDTPIDSILKAVQKRYHVFFIIPGNTQHFDDPELERSWVKLLGQQNVLKLNDPEQICEMIASAVAICENHAGIDDLIGDGVAAGVSDALVLLSKSTGEVSRYSADNLPPVSGPAGGSERI